MNVALYAQSSYEVSLYGKIDFCKITVGEKIVISPEKAGEMFFDPLKYDQEDFNENSLVLSLLSNKPIDIEDTIWKKDVTLVKSFPCKIRFLEAGDETINKKETTIYRLDIKLLEDANTAYASWEWITIFPRVRLGTFHFNLAGRFKQRMADSSLRFKMTLVLI